MTAPSSEAADQRNHQQEQVAKMVDESRAAQGLPPRITDPEILRRVAAVLSPERDEAPPKRGQADTFTTTTTSTTTTRGGRGGG